MDGWMDTLLLLERLLFQLVLFDYVSPVLIAVPLVVVNHEH